MNQTSIVAAVREFLAEARDAVVVEGGEVIFDFSSAKYALTVDHDKCVLHLWSEERNAVRRVLDAEQKDGVLRLTVQRFGQAKPSRLDICCDRDHRTPTARRSARSRYQAVLRRLLERSFPELKLERLTSTTDLEHSFSPVYARGVLRAGNRSWAVLGVNSEETQVAVDASLTFGLLWLDACRQSARQAVVEGLKLVVPAGRSLMVRERMAHLNRQTAKFELYEMDEREEALASADCTDRGNMATRLVHCPEPARARERFADSIGRILDAAPEAEVVPLSSAEVAFRIHGLEFARARLAPGPEFHNVEEIVWGAGRCEVRLDASNLDQFRAWARAVAAARQPGARRDSTLWRAQPERWLESLVARDVKLLDSSLDPAYSYSQVPAFSATDRAMIDVLSITGEGQLAVLELKAKEDIHLALQGLDYWARVEWHRARGEFQQFGYFAGRTISPQAPLLLLVAPALHVHPATDTLLRYLSPEIDFELIGIGENWREQVRVIFRKSRSRASCAAASSAAENNVD